MFSGRSLAAIAAVNIAAMIIARISPLSALKYLASLLPFIIFACVFNLVLGYVEDALNLAARLVMIANITQCYKKTVSTAELSSGIEFIFAPLRVFKVEGRDIALMVCISLAFLPVLRRDFASIRLALKAKGARLNHRGLKYFLPPFFIGILQRASEISRALRTKGYE